MRKLKDNLEKSLVLIKKNIQLGGSIIDPQLNLSLFLNETILAYIWDGVHLIPYTKKFYLLIPHLLNSNMIITTTKTKLSTTSCRIWQLLYITLYEWYCQDPIDMVMLMTKTYQLPVDISQYETMENVRNTIEIVKKNIDVEEDNEYIDSINILNKIIFFNDNLKTNGNDSIFQNITQITDFNQTNDENGIYNYCLCLNFQQIPGDLSGVGKILHYFTIVNIRNGSKNEWYLNSSYGSDFVKVPQYSTIINPEEFQLFLDFVNNKVIDKDQIEFTRLFIKYFLANQKQWYKEKMDAEDFCDPWYKCAQMLTDFTPENKELKYIIDNSYLEYLRVSWIKPYNSIIREVVNILK